MGDDVAGHWTTYAQEWIAWTRAPGHDAFWAYRDAFRAFLPPPGRRTLEVGCGEGRIARELTALGHRVTAVDLVAPLLDAARERSSAAHYARAQAEALPFADGVFDRVVVYNVLMDVADMPAAVAEMARVLAPGGAATISIVHPFAEACEVAPDDPDATFVVTGSYLDGGHHHDMQARDGLEMHFASWSYPLQDWIGALAASGLAVTGLAEPRPAVGRGFRHRLWDRMPLFCWLTAEHRAPP